MPGRGRARCGWRTVRTKCIGKRWPSGSCTSTRWIRAPMKLDNRVAVVTGGASGIGRALCRRFAAEGARAVVVADLNAAAAQTVAEETGGTSFGLNVAREGDVARLVQAVEAKFGAVDLFCSNAGIMVEGGPETADADWQRIWEINVMAHVYAARAVLPGMLAR